MDHEDAKEDRIIGPVAPGGVVLLALAIVVLGACAPPGTLGEGQADGTWGREEAPWTGGCRYERQTRWSANLPFILRLDEEPGERALVLQSNRDFPEGRSSIPAEGRTEILGLAFDGHTVIGSLEGTLEVTRRGDRTGYVVRGMSVRREAVPVLGRCTLGPPPR
jgi:hypothetical protein